MFLKTAGQGGGEFLPQWRWISKCSCLPEQAVSTQCQVPNLGGGKRAATKARGRLLCPHAA